MLGVEMRIGRDRGAIRMRLGRDRDAIRVRLGRDWDAIRNNLSLARGVDTPTFLLGAKYCFLGYKLIIQGITRYQRELELLQSKGNFQAGNRITPKCADKLIAIRLTCRQLLHHIFQRFIHLKRVLNRL
mgnify:CR=1 FL=1